MNKRNQAKGKRWAEEKQMQAVWDSIHAKQTVLDPVKWGMSTETKPFSIPWGSGANLNAAAGRNSKVYRDKVAHEKTTLKDVKLAKKFAQITTAFDKGVSDKLKFKKKTLENSVRDTNPEK